MAFLLSTSRWKTKVVREVLLSRSRGGWDFCRGCFLLYAALRGSPDNSGGLAPLHCPQVKEGCSFLLGGSARVCACCHGVISLPSHLSETTTAALIRVSVIACDQSHCRGSLEISTYVTLLIATCKTYCQPGNQHEKDV